MEEFYVTFGVQYTLDPEHGELHPLGMHKDGYAVIEAPDFGMAQRIAGAVFGNQYAFTYDTREFIDSGLLDKWYIDEHGHGRELLRISWQVPDDFDIINGARVHRASYNLGWDDGMAEMEAAK